MPARDLRQVAALAYDGLGTFEFGIVVEVFGLRRTGLDVKWYDFEVCSLERGPIRATGGILLQTQRGLRALEEAGTIIVPGWRLDGEPVNEELLAVLRAARFPQVRLQPDVLYVDEGSILTSAGSAAGIDLCLHIVRLDYGAEIANQMARRLVMPPHRERGPGAIRGGSGAQRAGRRLGSGDGSGSRPVRRPIGG